MRTFARNMGLLLGMILPVGIISYGLVLKYPADFQWGTWGRLEALLYFWIIGIPLVALGGVVHHLAMWLVSHTSWGVSDRLWTIITAPIVLLWWYLPMQWPLRPSFSDQPLTVLPFVLVVGLYAWLARPFGKRDGQSAARSEANSA